MATLHLPKNRPARKKETFEEKLERALDEGLKQSFPASDPVAVITPGSAISPDEERPGKKSGREADSAGR